MVEPRHTVQVLGTGDAAVLRELLTVYAEAFDDRASYLARQPGDEYLWSLLANPGFVAIVAQAGGQVVAGLAGYILPKFEQARSEFYIYDLAVASDHRRQGIATALIAELKRVCTKRGIYVIYVQADYGDDPAVALYEKLGTREDVMHFDIDVRSS
jgi:aminoglycoside 3-N-acetyltransferase I